MGQETVNFKTSKNQSGIAMPSEIMKSLKTKKKIKIKVKKEIKKGGK